MRSLSPVVINGGSRGGARGNRPPHPPYFYTKLRPEGRKNFLDTFSKGLDDPGPTLSQSLDPALVIDRFVDFVIKFRCLW